MEFNIFKIVEAKRKQHFNHKIDPRVGVVADYFHRHGELVSLLNTGWADEDPRVWDEIRRDLSLLRTRYGLTDDDFRVGAEIASNPLFDSERNWVQEADFAIERTK